MPRDPEQQRLATAYAAELRALHNRLILESNLPKKLDLDACRRWDWLAKQLKILGAPLSDALNVPNFRLGETPEPNNPHGYNRFRKQPAAPHSLKLTHFRARPKPKPSPPDDPPPESSVDPFGI